MRIDGAECCFSRQNEKWNGLGEMSQQAGRLFVETGDVKQVAKALGTSMSQAKCLMNRVRWALGGESHFPLFNLTDELICFLDELAERQEGGALSGEI